MISEQKAGRACNRIYASHKMGQLSTKEALDGLEFYSPYMSATQYCKFLDFLDIAHANELNGVRK